VKSRLFDKLQEAVAAWRLSAAPGAHTAPLVADESFFQYLVQNANSIILVSEMGTTKIIFANRFALDFFGYSEKELIGKPAVGTIIPPEESSGRDLVAMTAGIYRTPEMYIANENENLRKNGERVWVAWTNRALLNAKGEFAGLLSVGNDINERKRAEEEAKHSETVYRTIFDEASDAIFITDFEGRPLDVNEAACKMYGYTREELLAIAPQSLVAPGSLVDRRDRLDAIRQDGAHLEVTSMRKNGEPFRVEYNSTQIEYQGRQAVLNIVRDVTKRKQAEEELRRAESYYRMIFDHSSDPIFLASSDGRILDANPAAMDIYGYSREEFLEKYNSDLAQPDQVTRVPERIERVFREGYTSYETAHKAKDGRVLFLDSHTTRVTYEGKPAMLVVAHDVTERRERARQLSEFLSIASHELSLPVTIIKGYTQTLSRHLSGFSPEGLAEILDSINESANRLNGLVEELLDVTRIETGRLSLKKERVELEPLLLDTAKEIQFKADEHKFDIRLAPGAEIASGDPARIGQVLLILLDNASRFSPPASLIEIEAAVSSDGEGVVLSVLDRGIGVAEADRERIFEPFNQVEDVEHHGNSGLGMGLYIAREIVKGHSGKVWCESRPGGGSAFRFVLPSG